MNRISLNEVNLNWFFLSLGIVVLLIIIGTAGGIGLYIANALQPVEASDQEVRVSIPQGSGSMQIAEELETKGLIKNSSIFTYYLKVKKQGSRFQAGEYSMKPGMTFEEMIDKLNKGETCEGRNDSYYDS